MSRFIGLGVLLILYVEWSAQQLNSLSVGISAIATGLTLSSSDVRTLSDEGPNRNVIIEINNYLRVPLVGGSYFLRYGLSKYPPPTYVDRQTREAAVFYKVAHTATGTAGVLSYQIANTSFIPPCIFVVSWSVPYNYVHSQNWFGIHLLSPYDTLSWKTFENSYHDVSWTTRREFKDKSYRYANENRPAVVTCHNYLVTCTMSDYGRSIIKLSVQNGEFRDILLGL